MQGSAANFVKGNGINGKKINVKSDYLVSSSNFVNEDRRVESFEIATVEGVLSWISKTNIHRSESSYGQIVGKARN